MKQIRKSPIPLRIALSLCSVCISLVVVGFMYANGRQRPQISAYPTLLRRQNVLFPQVASFTHYYEPKPNEVQDVKPDWLGYGVTNYSNADGLNERGEYTVPKPPGIHRTIVLGDSFTYGSFVNTEQNYTEVLESLLASQRCDPSRHFEVINFGVPGYDIGFTVEHYLRKGKKYDPDLVIWLMNDFNFYQIRDLMMSREDEINAGTSEPDRKKREAVGNFYFAADTAMREFSRRFAAKDILRQQETYLLKFGMYYKGPLLFVRFSPDADSEIRSMLSRYARNRPRTRIYAALPSLTGLDARLPDTHPNAEGHRIIAANIYAYLYSNGVLPCHSPVGAR